MKRLGISVYPDYSEEKEIIDYLELASNYGFDVLFIALLNIDGTREEVIEQYKTITHTAKDLGYEISCDVNPQVFEKLGVNASLFKGPLDLSFFTELKVDILRLDYGMSDLEEAFLTKNNAGIKICFNGASITDHVGHVLSAGGKPENIIGCHNYYPHRYTGVSLDYFEKGTAHWNNHNLRLQSFVTSTQEDAFGPWPVTEGLPTLEMHRNLPIEVQMKHYLMMDTVDDILIGNAFATKDELRKMSEANSEKIEFSIELVDNLPSEQKERLKMNLSRRGDLNDYIIRTLESRMLNLEVEPFNTVPIKRGDVLIDNKLYGQYSGEVQIALQDMENSGKTNVVGHIDENEIMLIDYLKGGQPFTFSFIK